MGVEAPGAKNVISPTVGERLFFGEEYDIAKARTQSFYREGRGWLSLNTAPPCRPGPCETAMLVKKRYFG